MRLLRQGVAGLSQIGQLPGGGQLADLGLGQFALGQRAADLPLAARLHAGPMFAAVVVIRAVADHRHAQPLGKLLGP